jgi:hypothetical protein
MSLKPFGRAMLESVYMLIYIAQLLPVDIGVSEDLDPLAAGFT